MESSMSCAALQGLVGSGIDLGSKVCSSCARSREVAGEDWLDE